MDCEFHNTDLTNLKKTCKFRPQPKGRGPRVQITDCGMTIKMRSCNVLTSRVGAPEISCGALKTECLDRRIPDMASMQRDVEAWTTERNNRFCKVDWHFTIGEARGSRGNLLVN